MHTEPTQSRGPRGFFCLQVDRRGPVIVDVMPLSRCSMNRLLLILLVATPFAGCSDKANEESSKNQQPWVLLHKLEPHGEDCFDVNFSPDGTKLLTGSGYGTAQLWEVQNGWELVKIDCAATPTYHAIFSPDGKYILTSGSADPSLEIWHANEYHLVKKLRGNTPIYSDDGSQFLMQTRFGSGGSGPMIYDLVDANTFEVVDSDLMVSESEWPQFDLHPSDGHQLGDGWTSPDGKYRIFIHTNDNSRACVFDSSNQIVATLQGTGGINDVAWSPDGRMVAIGGRGESTVIWHLKD